MTTISIGTDIPTNINTLERLFFHVALTLNATIGATTFNLDGTADGGRTPHIVVNRGRASGNGKEYAQIVAYLPIDVRIDTNALNQRPWMYAEEISNNTYPSGYRAT